MLQAVYVGETCFPGVLVVTDQAVAAWVELYYTSTTGYTVHIHYYATHIHTHVLYSVGIVYIHSQYRGA